MMTTEFMHRGIRATISRSGHEQFLWAVFPAAYAEITGIVMAGEFHLGAKRAAAEACDEIDAWINTAG